MRQLCQNHLSTDICTSFSLVEMMLHFLLASGILPMLGKLIAATSSSDVPVFTCGSVATVDERPVLLFRSPGFPNYNQGDLICSFTFNLHNQPAGVALQLVEFETDSVKPGVENNECDQDILYIKGFGSWSPPGLCGNMSGYEVTIDDTHLHNVTTLTLLAVMSSDHYRWSMKVHIMPQERCPSSKRLSNRGKLYTRDAYGDLLRLNKEPRKKRSVGMQPLPPLVVNGDKVSFDQVPWQASVRLDTSHRVVSKLFPGTPMDSTGKECDRNERTLVCGAVIIGDREVVTAAHCLSFRTKIFSYVPIEALFIYVRDVNNCRDETLEDQRRVQVFRVDSVAIHFANEPKLFMNDIAIVRLNASIKFDAGVRKISMADEGETFYGRDAMVSGWGRTNYSYNTGVSTVLKYSKELRIGSYEECQKLQRPLTVPLSEELLKNGKYRGFYDSVLCTKPKNASNPAFFARGDSGGPLVSYREGLDEPVLVALVCFYMNTAAHTNFYTSVAYFRRWIDVTLCFHRLSDEN